MTEKRFRWERGLNRFKDTETGDDYYPYEPCELVDLLNALHELADGNEEQLLKVMTYLHDNHYDIWEEVNKECYDD